MSVVEDIYCVASLLELYDLINSPRVNSSTLDNVQKTYRPTAEFLLSKLSSQRWQLICMRVGQWPVLPLYIVHTRI